MGKFTSEFEFELSQELNYQCPTGEKTTTKLLFKAPSQKQKKLRIKLGKKLVKAIFNHGARNKNNSEIEKQEPKNNDKNDDNVDIDYAAILSILYSALTDDEYDEYTDLLFEMILDNLCYVARDIPLTESLLNEISADDYEEIIGHYSINFILPLWMKRQLKK